MKFFRQYLYSLSILGFAAASPLVSLPASAEADASASLTVEISGMQQAEGDLYISVYDSDDTWLGDTKVLYQKVVIADSRDGELVSTELQLPPGDYALSIYYDSNNNGELDTNFIGIPKEPSGLSNNARPRFGPPKYKDAVFTLGTEPVTQRISMEDI